ncbi:MAG: NAD-dependent DNA ligase LigA, partial [Bradymonadaceae bacterium]
MTTMTEDWHALTVEDLEEAVRYHNRKYWVENAPEISDPEFDRLVETLRERAPDSGVLDAIGPAGAEIVEEETTGAKIPHDPPMLSLDKAYDEETLLKWFDKFEGPCVATPKIDGVAASLHYRAGRLELAATRGNGVMGEDMTENARCIVDLPTTLDSVDFEVRGEAYMPVPVFEENFKDKYASPRNLTAGALKLKDPKKTADYQIHFFAYDLLGTDFETESQKLAYLARLGFETPSPVLVERENIQRTFDEISAARKSYPFETDGVVFKAEFVSEQQRLGHTSHHPRFAIAYKFQGDFGESVLREVHWSVSRTGAINPVGIVDPVSLSGAVVTRASLHNLSIMEHLGGEDGLRLGSRVIMMRRGGVIPNLEKVIEPGDEPVEIPSHCPGCGAQTYRANDVLVADHRENCRAARIRQLEHFVSVMEIKGFGPKLLEQLYDDGLVTEPADFYTLTVEELTSLERVGRKLADKLVERIQNQREVPAHVFLRSLGIDELGRHVSWILVDKYPSLDAIFEVSAEELAGIHTIGEVIAEKVTEGLAKNRLVIDDLLRQVTPIFKRREEAEPTDEQKGSPFFGKKVLFTGAMESMTRKEACHKVEELGGECPNSVVRDLDYLVMGDADMDKFAGGWRSS